MPIISLEFHTYTHTRTHTCTHTGTIVAMEKKPGILKPTAVKVIEDMRDSIERDLKQELS